MKQTIHLLTTFAVALGLSCSEPLDAKLPPNLDSWVADTTFQEAIQSLTAEEQKRLEAYRHRHRPDGPMEGLTWAPGTSIRHALAEQARWDVRMAQEQAERKKDEEAAAGKKKALADVLRVSLEEKTFKNADWRTGKETTELSAEFKFLNTGSRGVKGVRGKIVLQKASGHPVAEVPVLIGDGISGMHAHRFRHEFSYDPASASQRELVTTPKDKLVAVWEPTHIGFADGTALTLDE